MDQLVHDFNTALDETAGSNSSSISISSKRKAWKRRCKSTSNLLHAGQNISDDSSSSVDNVGLLSRDRGTSSLQFSDSDIEVGPIYGSEIRCGRNRQSRLQEYRNKRGGGEQLGIESDSFTENISPFKEFRGNVKRKKRFKRMAVDHPSSATSRTQQIHTGLASKRKKVRSRSGAEVGNIGKRGATGIVLGKRKRSAREKSVESGDMLGRSRTASLGEEGLSSIEKMEMEDVGSSSSLSSSEWEDLHSDGGPEGEDGQDCQADDEQSDWPGPEPGMSVMQLTDEEIDHEVSFSQLLEGPRKTVGRIIRTGNRRLKSSNNFQSGGSCPIIPAFSEQVSRFMQDSNLQTLRLPAVKSTDRKMILSLASLYSLSWSAEGQNILVLAKTSQTIKPASSEFAVPGIPTSRQQNLNIKERRAKDTKRQRRTPPLPSISLAIGQSSSSKGERQMSGPRLKSKTCSGSKSS